MEMKNIILYFLAGALFLTGFIGISYWAVNHFVKELTERGFQQFRERLAKETELALKLFKEGMSEQIVHQENKSDSMAKLYALLIDLLKVGKEFSTSMGKGDLQQAEKMLVGIRNTSGSFAEVYQKQRLHLSDEICAMLDTFVVEQKSVVEHLEVSWRVSRKDTAESKTLESGIRQVWLHCEDRISGLMDAMRSEFNKRQPSSANVIMKWLNQAPPPQDPSQPPADN